MALLMLLGTLALGTTAAESSPYKDVKPARWSFDEIMYATEHGYMNGKGGGLFAPEEFLTRAMVVTVLYRFQGEPEVKYSAIFEDVKAKDWYADAIIWAAENDIVNGIESRRFAPMDYVTREQLAAILMRYAPLEFIITDDTKDISGYKDYNKVHAYAKDAMAWANAVGIITGVTKTTLEPRSGATREQFAVMLMRFKENDTFKFKLVYNEPTGFSTYTEKEYPLVEDADIYVAVDGNDANSGTKDKPVATFARAKELVRELKKTATEEIKVAFKAGDYGNLDNLTFTAEDSGTAEVPITYCAYGDGEVIFSNGVLIAGDSFSKLDADELEMFAEKARDNIYKVDLAGKISKLESNNLVFSATGLCHEARYPNKKADGTDDCFRGFTTRVEEEGKEEYEYDKLELQGLAAVICDRFSTVEGMKITGMFRTGWFYDTFATKGYDKTTKYLTLDYENSGFESGYNLHQFPLAYEGRMTDTIFFHNLAELLDAEGEYWFDTKTCRLYVYKPNGDYAISTGGTFMTLESGADYLSFVGLEFNTSTSTAIDSHGNNVTFRLCTVGNIASEYALRADRVVNMTVTECEFFNFVSQGVAITSWTNRNLLIPGNNVIDNNYFHDFSLPQYFNASAVTISNDVAAKISHNYFENGAHSAIRYNACVDTEIEYNVFDNMMMTTDDFGAVYTWHADAFRDNKIRYNLFMNMAGGAKYSVYLDDGSSGQQVYGNIFYKVGAFVFNGGRDNVVHDNIFIKSGFLTYNSGVYGLVMDGKPEEVVNHANYQYLVNDRVNEGEVGYDLWRERWPIMYNFNIDPDRIDEKECLFRMVNYLDNNYVIGDEVRFNEVAQLFAEGENNVSFEETENPVFVDPTHGDYSIREDADFFKIPYKQIGRY